MTLWINVIGVPIGVWALYEPFSGRSVIPEWTLWLSGFNLIAFTLVLTSTYITIWRRTKLVLKSWPKRVAYMLRVNPISTMIWWVIWLIPLLIGLRMYLLDEGLIWQRTEKIDANRKLVRIQTDAAPTHR
jgi:glycosyltransferase XagB